MSTETEIQMLNVQIDGKWHRFPKGTRVIEACKQVGHFIPHYCYHPKLSSPGNCRMCLVEMGMPRMTPERKPILGADGKPEISWIPRPQISCAQDIAEGMGIRTDSPMVKECRNGVMEFLLINHPLDCPICDQAGECRLQEFSVEYGNGRSRFLDEKVKKPKRVELGPRVTLDDERCILCTRCIRFMREVAKDDVLGIVDRGSHSTLTCHPDRILDNNYSLNTVDICPVGALTNTDFRFKMRVWFLKETKTIDVNCGTGSNIVIGSREGKIYRITPRQNDDVNECWLPDSHRLNFKYIDREDRLREPYIRTASAESPASTAGLSGHQATTWDQALAHAVRDLQAAEGLAIIASGRMTNEELYLTRRLAAKLGAAELEILPRQGEPDGLLIAADRNPNTTGAQILKVTGETPGARLPIIASGIESGKINTLLLLGESALACGISEAALAGLRSVIVMDMLPNASTPFSHVVLPSSAFAEKRGSMVNLKSRIQRLNVAVPAPGLARDDWEILRDLLVALGDGEGLTTLEEVFRAMAADCPAFAGLTLSRIGDLGVQLDHA